MEFAEAKDVFDKEGLVIRIAGLVESVGSRGVEAIGRQVKSAVAVERSVAVINGTAEGQSAALQDRSLAPIFAEANVATAVIEFIRLQSRREGRRAAKALVAIVNVLVGVPALGLHEPAVAKGPFIAQDSGKTIDPGMIERCRGKIRIILELLEGETAGIATAKLSGVEIESEKLVFVRAIADIEVGLPLIVLAVVT